MILDLVKFYFVQVDRADGTHQWPSDARLSALIPSRVLDL